MTSQEEERDFAMDVREWYDNFTARRLNEAVQEAMPKIVQEVLPKALEKVLQEALPKAIKEALQEAQESWLLQTTSRLCGRCLGRPLTEAEHATLADRLKRFGEERVEDVILSSSPDALGVWLADPNAA